MQHSSALTSSPEASRNPGHTTITCAAHGVGHAPFSAPEWMTSDDDTIMARWCVGNPDAHGQTSITTLVTTPSGSFLTAKDPAAQTSRRTPQHRDDPTALTIIPKHIQISGSTAQERADMALADVRHAVTNGDPDVLAFFAPGVSLSTPATAVAAFYICDALWDKERMLQHAAVTGPQQAALRDAAVLLRAQAAQAHVPQTLGEVEHEVRARIAAVASTLCLQAAQADDHETAEAYGAAAEMLLRPTARARTAAESAISAARIFIDALQRSGLDEVASDAATSSVGVQAGLIHALDDVRDSVAETLNELAHALDRDLDVSALHEAVTNMTSAGEGLPGLLDELDPDRCRAVFEL